MNISWHLPKPVKFPKHNVPPDSMPQGTLIPLSLPERMGHETAIHPTPSDLNVKRSSNQHIGRAGWEEDPRQD